MPEQILWGEYLNWRKYITVDGADFPLPSEKDIQTAEAELGVTFPEEYKQVLMVHQGQVPSASVAVGEAVEPVGCLFHVFLDGPQKGYSIFAKRRRLLEDNADHLVPFTDNSSSSRFCFDFFADKTNPPVVFVDSDLDIEDPDAIVTVAQSFADFLQALKPT